MLNGLPGNPRTEVLVKSMIKTFKSMGLRVLVEGVELSEQAEVLKEFGADSIQGYYYGKPMPEDEFMAFIIQKGEADSERSTY